MYSICPACKQSPLVFTASMNYPSSMKSATCESCRFTTGNLKPNQEVNVLLARMLDRRRSPCIGLIGEDHSFLTLPFDAERALEIIKLKHASAGVTSTLVAFGLGDIAPVGLNNRHITNVETISKEWLNNTIKAFDSIPH